jgi:hypothetical protein
MVPGTLSDTLHQNVQYVKSSPDNFIIVRQLLPAGKLVERFAEHPPVGVLILHDHGHQLPHLFHKPLVGLFLLLVPRLVLVVIVVEFLLALAASLFGGGAGVVVLRLVIFVLVVLRSDSLRMRSCTISNFNSRVADPHSFHPDPDPAF